MLVRLQKVMAEAGVASRRAAEKLILAGRVSVNGQMVTELGTKVDPEGDVVTVDGKRADPARERVYVLLNKPRGYLSTVRDPEGRRTVLDLIGPIGLRLYPVGRLDMDTEGLLLLTNDGELTNALIHPRHEVPKTYVAEVEGTPGPGALSALQRGVRLEDGVTAPAEVKVLGGNDRGGTTLSITIHEGRNRQIRRMLEAVGNPATFLKRTRFGPLDLRGLKLGQHRYLTSAEITRLREAVGGARLARSHRRWRGRSVSAAADGAAGPLVAKQTQGSKPAGKARDLGPAKQPRALKLPSLDRPGRPARQDGPSTGRPARQNGPSTGRPARQDGPSTGRPARQDGPSTGRPARQNGPSTGRPARQDGPSTERPKIGRPKAGRPGNLPTANRPRAAAGVSRAGSKGSKRTTPRGK